MGKYYTGRNLPKNSKGARGRNAKRNPNGFIYCIYCKETGYYKIGVSVNPQRRLIDLDSSSPFKLHLLFSYYFENVYNMEECIHDSFQHRLVRREWFKLTKDEIVIFKSDLKQWSREGLLLTRK